jgi:hypothetical protein
MALVYRVHDNEEAQTLSPKEVREGQRTGRIICSIRGV